MNQVLDFENVIQLGMENGEEKGFYSLAAIFSSFDKKTPQITYVTTISCFREKSLMCQKSKTCHSILT